MKSNILAAIITWVLIFSMSSCKPQSTKKSVLIEQAKSEVLETHSLPLPDGVVTLNRTKLFEMEGKFFLMAYFYPRHNIYIYDLSKNELAYQINPGAICSINDMEFFNRDSIMIYGSSNDFKCDSVVQCVNLEGSIKHIYPLFGANIISSKNPAEPLLENKEELYPQAHFIFDQKVFLTFDYLYYGFKGYKKKHPLVGYYDLIKDTLVMNQDIWYPELDSTRYYTQPYYYQHSISVKENGNIDILFSYTPVLYEWNYKQNKIKKHIVNSRFMPIIPFTTTKPKEDSNDDNFNLVFGLYLSAESSVSKDKTKVYYREMILPASKYGDEKIIRVFFDSQYNYLGESLIDKDFFINYYKSVYYMSEIINGRLDFKFVKPVFKSFDENRLKLKLDSIEKLETEKNKKKGKETCGIVGRNETSFTYQKEDIVKYLQKNHQIEDTSFSIAIINSKGCGPCNEYLLNFAKTNQGVFFNIKTRPFYILYVSEGITDQDISAYLKGYMLTDKNHVKIDNSSIYKNFTITSLQNPRLVLVSQNKVIFDNTYLPSELDKYVNDLLDYYNVLNE